MSDAIQVYEGDGNPRLPLSDEYCIVAEFLAQEQDRYECWVSTDRQVLTVHPEFALVTTYQEAQEVRTQITSRYPNSHYLAIIHKSKALP